MLYHFTSLAAAEAQMTERYPMMHEHDAAATRSYSPTAMSRGRELIGYTTADLTHFARASVLAKKIDASIDRARFEAIIGPHKSEGYDSYKYFDKRKWLRVKVMRALELDLDRRACLSILDLGSGAGYFLYACKWLGHDVHSLELGTYEFYNEMIDLFEIPRIAFRIEAYKRMPTFQTKFDVVTAHQICFNGHKTPGL